MKRISLRNQDGQSMAEFALVLPILAFLLFAVIQFGIAFNNYITLTDATRAGARKAAASSTRRDPDPVGTCRAAVRNSANGLKQADLTADCVSDWESGSDVVVRATYPYSISLLGLFEKSGTLTSTTTERIE
jgi:Flp pilus assembly protein TadG